VAVDVYPPPESVTVPVGAGPEPETDPVTVRAAFDEMLEDPGTTVRLDASFVTVTVAVPESTP
jgi:hypothetical protein